MKRNWLIYVLTFSLALNGATAAAFIIFWVRNHTLAAASLSHKTIGSFLREDLKLPCEKTRAILNLVDQRKQEVMDLRAQLDSKRAELMRLIASAPVKREVVSAHMDDMSRTQSKLRSTAVDTVINIAESLPPEALDRFRAYLQARGRTSYVVSPPSSPEARDLPR